MRAILEFWDGYLAWATSPAGLELLTTAVIPFIAILAAGLIAAILARDGMIRVARRHDRDQQSAIIAGALASSRRVTAWASLSMAEQDQLDHRLAESLARLRMLPARGADAAAEWAELKLALVKTGSLTGSSSAEVELRDLEDWLIRWHRRPRRAARHFARDLESLRFRATQPIAEDAFRPRMATRIDTADLADILSG